MVKESKTTLVPKLRFPEFRNAEGWKPKLLGEVCGMQAGKFIAASEISEKQSEGLYPCFGGNGLRGYTKNYNQSGRYSLIGRQGALCGNVNLVEGDFYATEHAVVTTPKAGISTDWNFYNLCLLNLNRFATGQAQPGLSVDVLEKVNCAVPKDEDEQQKIADCLTSLDELIAAQGRKIEALKTYKRGLMQQLFPREGEALPRLRFPEFRDAPEWDVLPLCKVAENLDNKRVPITESERTKGSVPYYGASGVVDYVKDYLFNEELLCVSEDGANLVARTYPIAFPISGKTWVNNHAHVLRFKDSATQKIVEDYLNSIDLQDFIAGIAQPKLNRAMLDTIPVPLPEGDERKKLAAFLVSFDANLVGASGALNALRTHKNGLMQQLFPVLEENEA